MKAFITASLVSKLEPKSKQYDVRDSKLTGFLIRVNPTGKMFYVCQYKRGKRMNIGRVGLMSAAEARDEAIKILSQANLDMLPATNQQLAF